ncbi:MAG: hypothetical protein ACRDPT_05575 [Streptomycetales bacterium]
MTPTTNTPRRSKPTCPQRTNPAGQRHHDATDDDPAASAGTSREESSNRRARLAPKDREWVKRKAAELGPLTPEEREFLALIFRNSRRR